jgi:hypothetical protein
MIFLLRRLSEDDEQKRQRDHEDAYRDRKGAHYLRNSIAVTASHKKINRGFVRLRELHEWQDAVRLS